jgi:hypothetical protein
LGARLAGAGLLVGLVGSWLAVTRRPDWYHPVTIDRARLHADKVALAGLQDEISAALNEGREARFRVAEEQINRWLAERAEMFPGAVVDLGPLEDPQVSLAAGELRIAATATRLRTVLAFVCHVEVQDERVVVLYGGARLGVVPLPATWISGQLRELPVNHRDAIQSDAPGTVALENDWVWPNGKRRCRLRELRLLDGAAEVVVEPLALGRR